MSAGDSRRRYWRGVATAAAAFAALEVVRQIVMRRTGTPQAPAPKVPLPSPMERVGAIGMLHSCFRECRGTPRQGAFAPSTRGKIVLSHKIPADATNGLAEFSHVWVVFLFHQNTNLERNALTHAAETGRSFRCTVRPPALKGKAVGVFATRSPHRPNPIGITLVKLDAVEGRTLTISALDLVDGTPILDVKPYVTRYDSLPSARTPAWCGAVTGVVADCGNPVAFDAPAARAIDAAVARDGLRFYSDAADVRAAISELLATDVRPEEAYRKWSGGPGAGKPLTMRFDMLRISFVRTPRGATVTDAVLEDRRTDKALRAGMLKRYPGGEG